MVPPSKPGFLLFPCSRGSPYPSFQAGSSIFNFPCQIAGCRASALSRARSSSYSAPVSPRGRRLGSAETGGPNRSLSSPYGTGPWASMQATCPRGYTMASIRLGAARCGYRHRLADGRVLACYPMPLRPSALQHSAASPTRACAASNPLVGRPTVAFMLTKMCLSAERRAIRRRRF